MKVLFLDIDGVLNSEAWYRARPDGIWTEEREIDPEALWILRAIVEMTDCSIVISSSWRIGRHLDDFYRILPGLPVIGMTPVSRTNETRGAEVREWLKGNPVDRYAILDDNSDFYDDQPLVRTEWKIGLRPRHAERVVQMLTGDGGRE
ncbi:MAG TPA: HAD domain-containing protein [Terriglobales bacterium]|nr:HAD domain-containing protein [Terriglobales bacterium]